MPNNATSVENDRLDDQPGLAVATDTPAPRVLNPDDYGANPFDDQPDSRAIQSALKDLKPGETLEFTSGGGDEGYVGYLINETLFIVWGVENHDVVLTSSNPDDPALLQATEDLLGFVIRLFSRARDHNAGLMDNITLEHLVIDAGREERVCAGPDGILNGLDDNYGSWVDGECPVEEDPWCMAGGISLTGWVDFPDYEQDYRANPGRWTTGLWVKDVVIRNVECGTALGISGAESGVINSIIDTAGEHTHVAGCATTDPDGELAFWADGITFDGTNWLIENNTVINASDIGIVFFGGRDTRIINNTILSTEGNYGAFGAIQVGTVGFSDISGMEISGNTITSTSDQRCGGLHTGINLGQIMWNKGCVGEAGYGTVGNAGSCTDTPVPPEGERCVVGEICQIWAYVPADGSISLTDNLVRGAHINYLVQGFEVLGTFEISGNVSEAPQESDWEAANFGCGGQPWGPIDFVAWKPAIDGWTERAILCER
jgi:parallel beta-helix repeat protein